MKKRVSPAERRPSMSGARPTSKIFIVFIIQGNIEN